MSSLARLHLLLPSYLSAGIRGLPVAVYDRTVYVLSESDRAERIDNRANAEVQVNVEVKERVPNKQAPQELAMAGSTTSCQLCAPQSLQL